MLEIFSLPMLENEDGVRAGCVVQPTSLTHLASDRRTSTMPPGSLMKWQEELRPTLAVGPAPR
jgi:hypothetical protein